MKNINNLQKIAIIITLFLLPPLTLLQAEETIDLNKEGIIKPQEQLQELPIEATPTIEEAPYTEENQLFPKVSPFENQAQFPPEPEKMSYLRSMIYPGKKHQFLARCAAMALGNTCRLKNLKPLRRRINDALDEQYDKQAEKIFTPRAMFLFMINYGIRFSLFLASMGISVVEVVTQTEKMAKELPQINWLEVEDSALFLTDVLLAKKLNDWFLPEKDRDFLLAGAGGSVGTLGYILYYKFFFSDMVCLERTLNCFKNNPENFPASAFMILKKAESLMDKKALDTRTAALVCEQLRDMSRPK